MYIVKEFILKGIEVCKNILRNNDCMQTFI